MVACANLTRVLAVCIAMALVLVMSSSAGQATTHGNKRTPLERAGSVAWLFHLDARPLKHYLNYSGSKLTDLTRVRVDFQSTDKRGDLSVVRYEDFVYRERIPLGVKRYCNLEFPKGSGAIVVEPPAFPDDANPDAIVNVALRLLVDCCHKEAQAVKLQVCDDQYDAVANALESQGFSRRYQADGAQLCLHLRCDSYKEDERPFFYGK